MHVIRWLILLSEHILEFTSRELLFKIIDMYTKNIYLVIFTEYLD